MKKYRLKQDTVLYPKGIIVVPLITNGEVSMYALERNNTLFKPWQIEGNSLWEKITEDQIEEEIQEFNEVQNAIQECYNQCLAVECGEGECAKAIATKFPNHIVRYREHVEKMRQDYQALGGEITEDQREEKCKHPIETLIPYDDKNITRMECVTCGEKPVLYLDLREEEECKHKWGEIRSCSEECDITGKACLICKHIHIENVNYPKQPDHQALREESLKEMEDFKTRDFHKTSFPPKRVTQVTFSIPQRYADAWRNLLDDNKTP